MTRFHGAIALSVLALSGVAHARVAVAFQTPAFRGAPNSEFAGWESFSVPFGGPNFPDSPATTTNDASIVQTVAPNFSMPPGISVTGAGNIYSGFQNMNLVLSDTAPAALSTVWLQTRTLGTEWNYASVLLSYTTESGQQSLAPTVTELFREAGPPIMGNPTANVETLFTWDLSSLSTSVLSFSISLTHNAPHLSIDTVSLDTLSVPTPGVLALLAPVAIRRRRR